MKNIIVLMTIVLPLTLIGQTNSKSLKKQSFEQVKHQKPLPSVFSYMIMEVVSPIKKSEKANSGKLNFKFITKDSNIKKSLAKLNGKFDSVIEILDVLGSRGYELVGFQNNNYIFKKSKTKQVIRK